MHQSFLDELAEQVKFIFCIAKETLWIKAKPVYSSLNWEDKWNQLPLICTLTQQPWAAIHASFIYMKCDQKVWIHISDKSHLTGLNVFCVVLHDPTIYTSFHCFRDSWSLFKVRLFMPCVNLTASKNKEQCMCMTFHKTSKWLSQLINWCKQLLNMQK
jgi:hypothetical protein